MWMACSSVKMWAGLGTHSWVMTLSCLWGEKNQRFVQLVFLWSKFHFRLLVCFVFIVTIIIKIHSNGSVWKWKLCSFNSPWAYRPKWLLQLLWKTTLNMLGGKLLIFEIVQWPFSALNSQISKNLSCLINLIAMHAFLVVSFAGHFVEWWLSANLQSKIILKY